MVYKFYGYLSNGTLDEKEPCGFIAYNKELEMWQFYPDGNCSYGIRTLLKAAIEIAELNIQKPKG